MLVCGACALEGQPPVDIRPQRHEKQRDVPYEITSYDASVIADGMAVAVAGMLVDRLDEGFPTHAQPRRVRMSARMPPRNAITADLQLHVS